MKDKDFIQELAKGKGSLRHYRYYVAGIGLNTKERVREAINLKLKVMRRDKITKVIEQYNYKTKSFEVLK